MARGLTSMEFTEIMGKLKAASETPEHQAKLKRGERWLFSWDNDRVHTGADLEQVGITAEDRFPLPALSSDMHKVVENVHGWLAQQMQKWLEGKEDEELDVEECKKVLEGLFYDQYKREWIQKNVSSLKETYEAIVLADGGYPTAKHR